MCRPKRYTTCIHYTTNILTCWKKRIYIYLLDSVCKQCLKTLLFFLAKCRLIRSVFKHCGVSYLAWYLGVTAACCSNACYYYIIYYTKNPCSWQSYLLEPWRLNRAAQPFYLVVTTPRSRLQEVATIPIVAFAAEAHLRESVMRSDGVCAAESSSACPFTISLDDNLLYSFLLSPCF